MATQQSNDSVQIAKFETIHPEMVRVLRILANAQFTVGDTAFTSRVVNYYEERGLLLSTRGQETGWRRFSAYELVWLDILNHLRAFGYPIEWTKRLRDKLLVSQTSERVDKAGNYNSRPFEWFIALALTGKREMYYIVLEEGTDAFYDDASPQIWSLPNSYMRKAHISIPLGPIITQIWDSIPGEKVIFEKNELVEIDKTEQDILKLVRGGKFEHITIHFKNKKPQRMTGVQRKDIQKIEAILRENKFQKIELIQKDGKIVSVVSELSVKF